MKIKINTKGFTTLELILSVTLIAILLGFTVLYYHSSQVRADVNTQVSGFVAQLRLIQSNAASGLNDSSHGMHLETNSYTIFEGDTFVPNDSRNFEIQLSPTITIQNINLNGGGVDIIFTKPDGKTNNYGTLNFTAAQINKTTTITITQIGTINY